MNLWLTNLGKQMEVKYICDWHFFSFSHPLAWPMSKWAFAICDKAVNWRTHKSKCGKKDGLRAFPSFWISWQIGKASCLPTSIYLLVCFWFNIWGFFSATLLLGLGQRSRVFEQSGVYYSTCLSISSLLALLRSCWSNLFTAAIHTQIVQTRS